MLNELYVTAVNSKTEVDDRLNQEFLREFADTPKEVVEWAFQEHRRNSPFFPAISQIWELVNCRQDRLRVEAEQVRRKQQIAEWEAEALREKNENAEMKP